MIVVIYKGLPHLVLNWNQNSESTWTCMYSHSSGLTVWTPARQWISVLGHTDLWTQSLSKSDQWLRQSAHQHGTMTQEPLALAVAMSSILAQTPQAHMYVGMSDINLWHLSGSASFLPTMMLDALVYVNYSWVLYKKIQ